MLSHSHDLQYLPFCCSGHPFLYETSCSSSYRQQCQHGRFSQTAGSEPSDKQSSVSQLPQGL